MPQSEPPRHQTDASTGRADNDVEHTQNSSDDTSAAAARNPGGAPPLKIAFFGHDACESTVIKRATAFAHNNADVLGVMFRRTRKPNQRQVACPLIELGETVDRNYVARIPRLLSACGRLFKNRKQLKDRDAFYARNIDMLALAWFAKRVSGGSASLVYEVLDVQRVFLKDGTVGRVFRWLEKRLLAQSDLLVVSSPQFVENYFAPVQGYKGLVFLLENKISPHQLPEALPESPARPAGPPWRIGWFGTLRCTRSLGLLADIAKRMGENVEIHLRGLPSHEDLSEQQIQELCARQPNIKYFGAFSSPQDLPEIYGAVHFAWGFDYLDAGANSDWLLPNRVYEGGAFGAVCLTRSGTMTARYIQEKHLGHAIDEPVAEIVCGFLEQLDQVAYSAMASAVASQPRSTFIDETDTADLIAQMRR